MSKTVCHITGKETTVKQPSVMVRLLQKFNPKPIKDAIVRYDVDKKLWALLEHKPKENKWEIKQHFTMGVIENVTFETLEMDDARGLNCGSTYSTVGIARGDLYLHKSNHDTVGAHNLGFNGKGFFDEDKNELKNASKVVLMSDRRAIYFK